MIHGYRIHLSCRWVSNCESKRNFVLMRWHFQDDIPDSTGPPPDVWRVSASWVTDLIEYNEWMCEEDYEVDENGKKKIHKHRLSVDDLMPMDDKRSTGKAIASGSKQSKRKRSPSPPLKGGKRKRYVCRSRFGFDLFFIGFCPVFTSAVAHRLSWLRNPVAWISMMKKI